MKRNNQVAYLFNGFHHVVGTKDNQKHIRTPAGNLTPHIRVPQLHRFDKFEGIWERRPEKSCGRVYSKKGKHM